jgi:hypothetical protein
MVRDSKDLEQGAESTPLLDGRQGKGPQDQGFHEKEKAMIEEIEDVGKAKVQGNKKFYIAVQMTIRSAVFACLIATVAWVPFVRKVFPDSLEGYMGLATLLYFFTISGILGATVCNALVGTLGTFLACFHMWVMQGIYPGGVTPENGSTDTVVIFGWVSMIGFMFLILCAKTSIGLKMFALSYDVGFMLDFLNPNSGATYSEKFTINWSSGIAVNCVLATLIAVVLAVLTNLIPWPQTTAYSQMKEDAGKSSVDMSSLLNVAVRYYSGTGPSVVIEAANKKSKDLRAALDNNGGAISVAYFEGFDQGIRGTIRKLNEKHLDLLNNLHDRLKAILIALSTEDFAASHNSIMESIAAPSKNLADAAEQLLVVATAAIADGNLDEGEKNNVRELIEQVRQAVADLSRAFDRSRKTFNASIHPELLGESFFVLAISAYARLVTEFADTLVEHPPAVGSNLAVDFFNCVKSTFDIGDDGEVQHELCPSLHCGSRPG